MSIDSQTDLTLRDITRTFVRRRRTFFLTALGFFVLAALAAILSTHRYVASSVIEVQKSSADTLNLDSLDGVASGASDPLSATLELDTESKILDSDALALRVIQDLKLEDNQDFKPRFNPLGWVLDLVTPSGSPDSPGATLETSPKRRTRALKVWHKRLKVQVTAGTRLIEISFANPDAKVAAAVVNHLVESLTDYTFQTKSSATQDVSKRLQTELDDLRRQSEALQAKVVASEKGSGLFGIVGSNPQGQPVVFSPVLDRLQSSTTEFTQARLNRILKGSIYDVVKTGNGELISQLSGTSLSAGGNTGVVNSLNLIQSLRAQESTISANIEQDSAVFGPAYPKLIEEKASLEHVRESLREEVGRITQRAANDYDVAKKVEAGAKESYDADRIAAERLNDRTVDHDILQREASQSQLMYQDLLKRLKEGGILDELHSSNLTVVDKAYPPAKPTSPNVIVYLALGVFMGSVFGAVAAFVRESTDPTLRWPDELGKLKIPVVGVVPDIQSSPGAPSILIRSGDDPDFSESIRRLRTEILASVHETDRPVLLVTDLDNSHARSVIAANLASSVASLGTEVLLVEADLRSLSEHKWDSAATQQRLVQTEGNLAAWNMGAPVPSSPHLHQVSVVKSASFPDDLFNPGSLQAAVDAWRTRYSYIVINAPSVSPYADTLILQAFADVALIVASIGHTKKAELENAWQSLVKHTKSVSEPLVGVVVSDPLGDLSTSIEADQTARLPRFKTGDRYAAS